MSTPRPLINKKTSELSQLFREWRNSPERLRVLLGELKCRNRPGAVRLRQEVEDALANPGRPESNSRRQGSAQLTLDIGIEPSLEPRQSTRSALPRRLPFAPSKSHSAPVERFTPPDQFTLVQPLGVQPRPSAFHPPLKTDLTLDVSPNDAPATVFCVALNELIQEMRRRGVGHQAFVLENGARVRQEADGFSYQFEFGQDANIFEGAAVELIIGGRKATGFLTAIMQGRIIVTLKDDFGEEISSCILRIDNTALLQALHDRLEEINSGQVSGFRTQFAASVLKNVGAENAPTETVTWPWAQEPTDAQHRFIGVALANEISWLWGPPGTGKTDTLSALTRVLYERGKRVLVCSNTNQAVDQLVHKLCRMMNETEDPALPDGRVLRLGKIDSMDEALKAEFGEYILAERIVERRSAALIRRKAEVAAELERLGREVGYAQAVLRRFAELEDLKKVALEAKDHHRGVERDRGQVESGLKDVERAYARLAEELAHFQNAGAIRRFFMRDETHIRKDLVAQDARVKQATVLRDNAEKRLAVLLDVLERAAVDARTQEQTLADEDRAHRCRVRQEMSATPRGTR